MWVPRALPGRTHRIVKTCVRLRIPVLAGLAYAGAGAGGTFAVSLRRKSHHEFTAGQRSLIRAYSRFWYPRSNEAWRHSSGGGSSAMLAAAQTS